MASVDSDDALFTLLHARHHASKWRASWPRLSSADVTQCQHDACVSTSHTAPSRGGILVDQVDGHICRSLTTRHLTLFVLIETVWLHKTPAAGSGGALQLSQIELEAFWAYSLPYSRLLQTTSSDLVGVK